LKQEKSNLCEYLSTLKGAGSGMKKYVCDLCFWEYDEAAGDESNGIAPGTKWSDLPDDFTCPPCGADKDQFSEA